CSLDNSPVVGDRFVAVGDAIAFVDPIFSGGVYIALRSGQLASVAIRDAFRAGDFSARRFADYERRVRAGLDPLFKFIHKYYEPSFFDLLMRPRNHFGIYEAVLNVLSGGIGVTGIVALGAMAERIVRFIDGGDRFVLGQISVAGRGMGMGAGFTAGGLLPAAAIEAIRKVEGVAGVQPQVMLPLNPSTSQFMTLTQELVIGMDLSVPSPNRHYRTLPVQAGRFLREGDRRKAVVGASFAVSRRLAPGSRL